MLAHLLLAAFGQTPMLDPAAAKAVAVVEQYLTDFGVKGPFRIETLRNGAPNPLYWSIDVVSADHVMYRGAVQTDTFAAGFYRGHANYDQSDLPNADLVTRDSPILLKQANSYLAALGKRSELGEPLLQLFNGTDATIFVGAQQNGHPFEGPLAASNQLRFRPGIDQPLEFHSAMGILPVSAKDPTIAERSARPKARQVFDADVFPGFPEKPFVDIKSGGLKGRARLAYFRSLNDKIATLSWMFPFEVDFKPIPQKNLLGFRLEKQPAARHTVYGDIAIDATTGDFVAAMTKSFPPNRLEPLRKKKLGKFLFLSYNAPTSVARLHPTFQGEDRFLEVKAAAPVGEDLAKLALAAVQKTGVDVSGLRLTDLHLDPLNNDKSTWIIAFANGNVTYEVILDRATKEILSVKTK